MQQCEYNSTACSTLHSMQQRKYNSGPQQSEVQVPLRSTTRSSIHTTPVHSMQQLVYIQSALWTTAIRSRNITPVHNMQQYIYHSGPQHVAVYIHSAPQHAYSRITTIQLHSMQQSKSYDSICISRNTYDRVRCMVQNELLCM